MKGAPNFKYFYVDRTDVKNIYLESHFWTLITNDWRFTSFFNTNFQTSQFWIFFSFSEIFAILTKFWNFSQNMFEKITQHSLNFVNSAKILNFLKLHYIYKISQIWTHFDKKFSKNYLWKSSTLFILVKISNWMGSIHVLNTWQIKNI
jgi:hypothetical protein